MNTLLIDIINFIEAHKADFVILFAWLCRELATVGNAGGFVGLWKFIVYGIKPAIPAQPEKLPTTQVDQQTSALKNAP